MPDAYRGTRKLGNMMFVFNNLGVFLMATYKL